MDESWQLNSWTQRKFGEAMVKSVSMLSAYQSAVCELSTLGLPTKFKVKM